VLADDLSAADSQGSSIVRFRGRKWRDAVITSGQGPKKVLFGAFSLWLGVDPLAGGILSQTTICANDCMQCSEGSSEGRHGSMLLEMLCLANCIQALADLQQQSRVAAERREKTRSVIQGLGCSVEEKKGESIERLAMIGPSGSG
jgi:hypothetical protein